MSNNWFTKSKGQRMLQGSWYGLFVVKHKIPFDKFKAIVDEYIELTFIHPKGAQISRNDILKSLSENFTPFIKFISEKTGKRFQVNKERPKRDNWSREWQRSNLDGTFAYNGVTEDF